MEQGINASVCEEVLSYVLVYHLSVTYDETYNQAHSNRATIEFFDACCCCCWFLIRSGIYNRNSTRNFYMAASVS